MTRRILTTAAIASFSAAFAPVQTSASQGASTPPQPALVVGCIAKMDSGFQLKTMAFAAGVRTGGSNSAKSSTPLGRQRTMEAPKESAGSNSAKASTPIRTATSGSSGRRTGGVMTPKGSVPVAGSPLESTYDVDADPVQLAPHVDHIVEIKGTTVPSPESAAAYRLKVETLRVLSSTCAR